MRFPNFKKDNSLSEKVYQAIYRQIVSGNLKPGDKITETAISIAMGISRAPVREALKRLAEDHLVVLVARSGCFVAELNREEVDEIYEIRKRLECMALEYAFDKLDIREVHELRDKLQQCLTLSQPSPINEEIKLDTQLHRMIAQSSGCKNLQEMLDKLRARVQVFRVREADYANRAVEALKEHINILNAIVASDKEAAIKHLATHIEHTKKNVLTKFA